MEAKLLAQPLSPLLIMMTVSNVDVADDVLAVRRRISKEFSFQDVSRNAKFTPENYGQLE